jgi:uncharacterized protein YvpB
MKTTLEVPFYSQKEIVTNGEGDSACGIVCVKMILDYKTDDRLQNTEHRISIDDLVKEGYIVGGKEEAGWKHETIVRVLRNHGIMAFRQEFIAHEVVISKQKVESSKGVLNEEVTEEMRGVALTKFEMFIDQGYPVMTSMRPGFGENGGDHLVLIVGYDEDNLYINDSQMGSDEGSPIAVSKKKFMEYWKGLSVFVEW